MMVRCTECGTVHDLMNFDYLSEIEPDPKTNSKQPTYVYQAQARCTCNEVEIIVTATSTEYPFPSEDQITVTEVIGGTPVESDDVEPDKIHKLSSDSGTDTMYA